MALNLTPRDRAIGYPSGSRTPPLLAAFTPALRISTPVVAPTAAQAPGRPAGPANMCCQRGPHVCRTSRCARPPGRQTGGNTTQDEYGRCASCQLSTIASLPAWLVVLANGNMMFGNAPMIAVGMLAVRRRRNTHLAAFGLLSPMYWMLHSAAAWRALFQVILDPFTGRRPARPGQLQPGTHL